MQQPSSQHDPGFEMHDLLESDNFTRRALKPHNRQRQQLALSKVGKQLFATPETMLQALVEIAVDFCGADSAGVSLEENNDQNKVQFRWIVVAGSFEKYLNGTTPRNYSPCGVCLDHWRPQYYKIAQPYYDFLGVTAEPILDGMLIPWNSNSKRGTIWAVSHGSETAFDMKDYSLLHELADLVAVAMRHRKVNPS